MRASDAAQTRDVTMGTSASVPPSKPQATSIRAGAECKHRKYSQKVPKKGKYALPPAEAPRTGTDPPADAPRTDASAEEDDGAGRACVCDERVECGSCTPEKTCELHDGLFCSYCSLWHHAGCVGGVITEDDHGKRITFPYKKPFVVDLQSASQELDGAWACPKCWESRKAQGKSKDDTFEACSDEVKSLRLGIDVPTNGRGGPRLLPQSMKKRLMS